MRLHLNVSVFSVAAQVLLSASLVSAAASNVPRRSAQMLVPTSTRAPQPASQGKVAWRFTVRANYISHRADVGQDGTVYFNDSSGFLYALTPDGALKWLYSGHGSGSQGPTVVGPDGTIYFGTASLSAIHAINPDGTRKWIFKAKNTQGPI